jgi:hypothetical protein
LVQFDTLTMPFFSLQRARYHDIKLIAAKHPYNIAVVILSTINHNP